MLELMMLKFTVQSGRPRVTILGLMIAVFVCAVILAYIIETRRIKRAQASFRQRAATYAQLEKRERANASWLLNQALFHKQSCERDRKRIERLLSMLADPRFWDHKDNLLQKVRNAERSSEFDIALGKEWFLDAQRAMAKADRIAALRQAYSGAASCLWLPFTPSRLPARDPADEVSWDSAVPETPSIPGSPGAPRDARERNWGAETALLDTHILGPRRLRVV
jgi:hypothetical protein